jgi:selenocysteine lyase/cysteine desulfurase
MIPSQRHLFDIPADVAYLNCAFMSPLMHAVVAAGERAIQRKARPWEIKPEHFFPDVDEGRRLFAGIIGANAGDIAVVPSASYGIATAARNLPLAPGRTVLLLQDQFPSNVYAWQEAARQAGAAVTTVPRPVDGDWTRAAMALLDERTAITALPHCHWTDGGLLDLRTIGARCREVGSALVADITQSAGALAFDIAAVQPDFVVAATYKWLLGPYSLGFLYVAPRWREGRPLEHNWIARKGSEDFAGLVRYQADFQPGAQRFDMGERSNFHLLPMANEAMRRIHGWGVGEIATTLARTTTAIADRARSLGLTSAPAALRAGHFLGLRFPTSVPDGLLASLASNHVHVSVRGDSMRVTPHLYNTDEDVDRLIHALEIAL